MISTLTTRHEEITIFALGRNRVVSKHRPPREGHRRSSRAPARRPLRLAHSLVGRRVRSRARQPAAARRLTRRLACLARNGGSLPVPLSAPALCGPRHHGCWRRPLCRVSLMCAHWSAAPRLAPPREPHPRAHGPVAPRLTPPQQAGAGGTLAPPWQAVVGATLPARAPWRLAELADCPCRPHSPRRSC
jgi:hypothetical protein